MKIYLSFRQVTVDHGYKPENVFIFTKDELIGTQAELKLNNFEKEKLFMS